MKSVAIVPVLCALAVGCARSPDQPVTSMGEALPTKEVSRTSSDSTSGDVFVAQPVPSPVTGPAEAGNSYPAKDEVLAIL
jgi:hypothetical protein